MFQSQYGIIQKVPINAFLKFNLRDATKPRKKAASSEQHLYGKMCRYFVLKAKASTASLFCCYCLLRHRALSPAYKVVLGNIANSGNAILNYFTAPTHTCQMGQLFHPEP